MTPGHAFADAVKEYDFVARNARIVKLRTEGKTPHETATLVGCDVRTVYRVIKDEADRCRAATGDLVDEMFMLHQERLERMWAAAQKRLDELSPLAPAADWCAAVRAAIMIMERQSRLLGLDRERNLGGANKADWLDGASEEELRATASRYGLHVPERLTGTLAS